MSMGYNSWVFHLPTWRFKISRQEEVSSINTFQMVFGAVGLLIIGVNLVVVPLRALIST